MITKKDLEKKINIKKREKEIENIVIHVIDTMRIKSILSSDNILSKLSDKIIENLIDELISNIKSFDNEYNIIDTNEKYLTRAHYYTEINDFLEVVKSISDKSITNHDFDHSYPIGLYNKRIEEIPRPTIEVLALKNVKFANRTNFSYGSNTSTTFTIDDVSFVGFLYKSTIVVHIYIPTDKVINNLFVNGYKETEIEILNKYSDNNKLPWFKRIINFIKEKYRDIA